MRHREFKDQLYAEFARIGKALASPQRLELLDLLAQGERSRSRIWRGRRRSQSRTPRSTSCASQARLVESRKEGLYVYYRLADPAVYTSGGHCATWASTNFPRLTGSSSLHASS